MADLNDLLIKTSRTFALSIPLLPEPTRRDVTVAYLLFRIADTFEDASTWPRERRIEALADFGRILDGSSKTEEDALTSRWVDELPGTHAGYRELLEKTPFVLACFRSLAPTSREIVKRHLQRTARGMSEFVSRTGDSGELRLRDLTDLRAYCYVVAGIVGEMLTELFITSQPSLSVVADDLRSRSGRFGEGLQLVNILKDAADDISEGRSYLPRGLGRARVFELARDDLMVASEYVLVLQNASAPRGLVEFNAVPVLLAQATLDRVEQCGAGSKLTRQEVLDLVERMNRALDHGEPAFDVAPGRLSGSTRRHREAKQGG